MDITTSFGFVEVHRHFCQVRRRKGVGGNGELEEVVGCKASVVNSIDLVFCGGRNQDAIQYLVKCGSQSEEDRASNRVKIGRAAF